MAIVDVILPVKNRDTVRVVVATILREMAAAKNVALGKLWVCDGGSTEAACLRQIEIVSEWHKVHVLCCEHSGFNKGWLINQGLAVVTGQVVLISDVDILWRAAALEAIALSAAKHPQRICSVLNVRESDPATAAVQRQRYTYRIAVREADTLVEVHEALADGEVRPGCGIVCAQRQVFENIGGYKACFVGWGWEDQDLLIRAQLLGYEVMALGEVMHLSHGDERRSITAKSVEWSRDRNIMRCLTALEKGELRGDLAEDYAVVSHPISVQYPPQLGE